MSPRRVLRGSWLAAGAALVCVAGVAGCSSGAEQLPAHATALAGTPTSSAKGSPGPVAPPHPGTTSVQPVPAGSPGVVSGTPTGVDRGDPTAVSRAVVITSYTSDTRLDTTPWDAQRRATQWMTPAYAAAVTDSAPVAAPGRDWNELAAHQGYTEVSVSADNDDPVPDTGQDAYRQWTAVVTPRGRDGWTGEPTTVVAYVHLVRDGGSWNAAEVRSQ